MSYGPSERILEWRLYRKVAEREHFWIFYRTSHSHQQKYQRGRRWCSMRLSQLSDSTCLRRTLRNTSPQTSSMNGVRGGLRGQLPPEPKERRVIVNGFTEWNKKANSKLDSTSAENGSQVHCSDLLSGRVSTHLWMADMSLKSPVPTRTYRQSTLVLAPAPGALFAQEPFKLRCMHVSKC